MTGGKTAMVIEQVPPNEVFRRMRDTGCVYIDVRTEPEFASGHPEGAVNIPVGVVPAGGGQLTLNPDFVATVAAQYPKDAPIVVGCQSGGRSQRAAEILVHAGYRQVANMTGGFGGMRDADGRTVARGWQDSALPVCRQCGDAHSYAALRQRQAPSART